MMFYMKWRRGPIALQLCCTAIAAYFDSWIGGAGWLALLLAALVLAPAVISSCFAPSDRAAWWVAAVCPAMLFGCIFASRVWSTSGPAAPIFDWWAPYFVATTVVYFAVAFVARAGRTALVLALLPAVCISSAWGYGTSMGNESGGSGATPRSVQPLLSTWRVSVNQPEHCSQNGATCESRITVADATLEEIEGQLRRAGWSSHCRPNTGLLSHLGFFDYGRTCITVSNVSGGVMIDILGEATWWVRRPRPPGG